MTPESTFNVEDVFSDLDTSEIDFKKVIKEDYQEVFDEDEMDIMVEYLENNSDMMNIAILLMFATGARIGEIVALKHSDFRGNTFLIRRTETRFVGEDGKYICSVKDFPKSQAGVRTAIIPDKFNWVCQEIQRINPNEEYIFVKNGKRITAQAVRMRLKRLCQNLGIYHKSPQKIRKTYGTILLDNHVDHQVILGQMGHTDIMCTETHYHRNRRNLTEKTQILNAIPEFSDMNRKKTS